MQWTNHWKKTAKNYKLKQRYRGGGRAIDLVGPRVYQGGGQSLKLSTKAAVFKRVSKLVDWGGGGCKHVDWEGAGPLVPLWHRPCSAIIRNSRRVGH